MLTLPDYAAAARQQLPPELWAYFARGAGAEITLRANKLGWDAVPLCPRVLCPRPVEVSLSVSLLDRTWPTPLLVAPMAQMALAHAEAEAGLAMAAAAQGVGLVLSQQSNTPMEQVAKLSRADPARGPLWFQLYHTGDRGQTLALMQQAHACGYEALVLTVDAPIQGVRDQELRHPIAAKPHLKRPHWNTPPASDQSALLHSIPTWNEVQWLVAHSPLPLLLKGITHPHDAALASNLGVAGMIVSNHGGRVLDGVAATAALLPQIADQIKGRCELLVDGGIYRGSDAFKALALGASAVLIGRPVLWGLVHSGALGASRVLRLLLDELWATLVLCGVGGTTQISPSCIGKKIESAAVAYDSHL